jgi:hypothetical protein
MRETHEAPAEIRQRLARAGHSNRYGESNFRVVWGGSRLSWNGGRRTDHDTSGNVIRETIDLRQVPKYVPLAHRALELTGIRPRARRSPLPPGAATLVALSEAIAALPRPGVRAEILGDAWRRPARVFHRFHRYAQVFLRGVVDGNSRKF